MNFKLDHIAIQALDYQNTITWYKDFFGCEEQWYRKKEQLPQAIQNRMPNCTQLVELKVDQIRFHIFDITVPHIVQPKNALQIEHYCVEVDTLDDLKALRKHWVNLYESGKYRFETSEMPTELIPSSDGMVGFYTHDPNGIEIEAFFLPK